METDECVFCAIVQGRAEASFVHADDAVVAFMDLNPINPGHLLVVPRSHRPYLNDLDEHVGALMWRVAHRCVRALRRSGLRADGVNLFLADGEPAGQEVFHAHLHVIPRYSGDSLRIETHAQRGERAELDTNAALIGRVLAGLPAVPA
ncbi:MAG: HIT family protein [Micromonosporaceae bacterium]